MPTPPQLIREVIASFIDHQNYLSLHLGECLVRGYPSHGWIIDVHADDMRKVVGKSGTHIMALQHLFQRMQSGRAWPLILRDPQPAIVTAQCAPVKAERYDFRRAQTLIQSLVIALGCPQTVVACDSRANGGSTGELAFTFVFHAPNEAEYDRLTVPHPTDTKNRTLVASLGTLFKAIARKDGVDFDIVVPRV